MGARDGRSWPLAARFWGRQDVSCRSLTAGVAGSESEHAGLGVFGLVYRISFSQRESSFHFFSLVSRPGSKVLGSELWIGLKMLQASSWLTRGFVLATRDTLAGRGTMCVYIYFMQLASSNAWIAVDLNTVRRAGLPWTSKKTQRKLHAE